MENIDFSLIIAQLINFLILFYLFKRYIAKHLNNVIEQRNATVEKVRLFETSYDKKIQDLELKESEMIAAARKKAQNLARDAENISHKKAEEIITAAHAQALQILEGGRREIEKERKTMYAQLKESVLSLTLRLVEKLFGTEKVNREYLEKELKEID